MLTARDIPMLQPATVIKLINSLLSNAHDLLDDAQVLHDAGRYQRALALATMAAEEHGKLEFCLDQLLGDPPRTERQFRQAWTAHREKLENLVAFRLAFVDDLPLPAREEAQAEPARLHHERMAAIYVDLVGETVEVPVADEKQSERMISEVRASVNWVEPLLRQLTPEMVPLLKAVAPQIDHNLTSHLADLPIDGALTQLRAIITGLPNRTDEQISESLRTCDFTDLLGLPTRQSEVDVDDRAARLRVTQSGGAPADAQVGCFEVEH